MRVYGFVLIAALCLHSKSVGVRSGICGGTGNADFSTAAVAGATRGPAVVSSPIADVGC